MVPDSIKIYTNFSSLFFESAANVVSQQLRALQHRQTYRSSPDARNVVVLGGSFGGLQLAKRLSQSLPSGYRVVLVEQNSHFNYVFNFPRYAVVGDDGRERKAFVPYTNAFQNSAEGSWVIVRDKATDITSGSVVLQSGTALPFDYLAIATGVLQPLPAKVLSVERDDACAELREFRKHIHSSQKIAIVGGGAVGVQLAADIKSAFPEKEVVLVHSRDRLLNSFGERLSDFVRDKLLALGVSVMLGERPPMPSTKVNAEIAKNAKIRGMGGQLVFKDGRIEDFDAVIPCTGATPNSEVVSSFSPNSISPTTGKIIVRPTLQIADDAHPHVFALGDVTETNGPNMARAAMTQADLVSANIVALIRGKKLQCYIPSAIEGFLKLSLGMKENVIYVRDGKGGDIMVPGKAKNLDLDVRQAWWYLNANIKGE